MTAHSPQQGLAQLEHVLADAPASVRLYLRPVAIFGGPPAVEMAAAGRARRLAGGPLAASFCEVLVRGGDGLDRPIVEIAALESWAARAAGDLAARIATLLERIAAPRLGDDGCPCLMGVINVTPDSFSDGGEHVDPAAALAHAQALASAGAGILDIGGESTRPGAEPVSASEELVRVLPVLEGLRARGRGLPGVALSIDTRHALVMRAALALGADIINDVTALTGDPESLATAAGSGARVVLMHMQGEPATMNLAPAYDNVALDVFDFLEARIEACAAMGIEPRRLIVDPGIGFGKRGPDNLAILRALPLFHGLGCPILLGLSRKGIGAGPGSASPKQRLPASLGAAMYALSQGVQMLRVHDLAETGQVVELWRRLNHAAE